MTIPASAAFADGGVAQPIFTVEHPGAEPYRFDLDGLDKLSQVEIRTENEFYSGMASYSGPLAREVVKGAGGDANSTIILTAANDYEITVPAKDFFEYDVVLATRINGETLSPRGKGPIWLMYPISNHDELRDSTVNSKLIWQLVKMEVR